MDATKYIGAYTRKHNEGLMHEWANRIKHISRQLAHETMNVNITPNRCLSTNSSRIKDDPKQLYDHSFSHEPHLNMSTNIGRDSVCGVALRP